MWSIAAVAQAHTFPPIMTAGSPVTALGYGPSRTRSNPVPLEPARHSVSCVWSRSTLSEWSLLVHDDA